MVVRTTIFDTVKCRIISILWQQLQKQAKNIDIMKWMAWTHLNTRKTNPHGCFTVNYVLFIAVAFI